MISYGCWCHGGDEVHLVVLGSCKFVGYLAVEFVFGLHGGGGRVVAVVV